MNLDNLQFFSKFTRPICYLVLILFYFVDVIKTQNYTQTFAYSIPGRSWPNDTDFIAYYNTTPNVISLRNDSNYKPYTYNTRTNTPKPVVIVTPTEISHIKDAINFARSKKLKISIQSTGSHPDIRNIQDNSVHIVMSKMKSASYDAILKTITIGTGMTFGEIHTFVAQQTDSTLIALSPLDNGKGPYSFYTGGGRGIFTKRYGLAVDALVEAQILLYDGTVITANNNTNKDLLRALRGVSGSSFGVVLNLKIKLFDNPKKITLIKGYDNFGDYPSNTYLNFLSSMNNDMNLLYHVGMRNNKNYVYFEAFCIGVTSNCDNMLTSFKTNCQTGNTTGLCNIETYDDNTKVYNYLKNLPKNSGGKPFYTVSSYFSSSNYINGLNALHLFVKNRNSYFCSSNAILGGVSSNLDGSRTETSIGLEQRNSFMEVYCTGELEGFSGDEIVSQRKNMTIDLDMFAEKTLRTYSEAVYWNNPNHNFTVSNNDWKQRYWGGIDNYNKLVAVKNQYDPSNVFTCYHCIGYDEITQGLEPAICEVSSCTCTNNPWGKCSINSKIINLSGSYSKLSNLKYLLIILFIVFII